MSDSLGRISHEWLAAREVIIVFLRELRPDLGRRELEHNAAALIARLASHEPPILLSQE
jgi:hypothetical protein